MFDKTQLTSLQPNTEVISTAESATDEHEIMQIAHVINSAANTGEHVILYNSRLSQPTREMLKFQGYDVQPNLAGADPESQWIITAQKEG